MKTIVFSEPVEAKLKELKIKTKVVRNIRSSTDNKAMTKLEFKRFLETLIASTVTSIVLFYAFQWRLSPEQDQYWEDVYNKL